MPLNQQEHIGAPRTAIKSTAAAYDVIAAPGANKNLVIASINCDVTVAEAGKVMTITDGTNVLASFSLASVISHPTKIFDPPVKLANNTKLSIATTGTTGTANFVIGYYKATNDQ